MVKENGDDGNGCIKVGQQVVARDIVPLPGTQKQMDEGDIAGAVESVLSGDRKEGYKDDKSLYNSIDFGIETGEFLAALAAKVDELSKYFIDPNNKTKFEIGEFVSYDDGATFIINGYEFIIEKTEPYDRLEIYLKSDKTKKIRVFSEIDSENKDDIEIILEEIVKAKSIPDKIKFYEELLRKGYFDKQIEEILS